MNMIFVVFALAVSFFTSSDNAPSNAGAAKFDIDYYWFDTCGNYLRQNTLDDESFLTGFDNIPNLPSTLHEIGFDPQSCTGWPPVPIDFDLYDELLYSHP